MKNTNIYSGLIVAILMLASAMAHAEVVGLKSDAECKKNVLLITDLTSAMSNLSPQTAADYFDANNNRFVFCMKITGNSIPVVTTPITLTNNSGYPVIIKGLIIDSSKKDPNDQTKYLVPTGTSLLTIGQGNGEIAFQNLSTKNADSEVVGLRAPILLQGKTTLLDSTISCDAANTAPGITVSSNNNTFRKVNINECSGGLGVTGSFNNFYEVAIIKTAADESQTGGWGLTSTGTANSFFALAIQNYKGGAMLWGNNNKILAMQVTEGTVGAFKNAEGAWGLPSVIRGFTKEVQGMDGKPVQEPVNNSIGVYFKASGTLDYSTVDGVAFGVGVEANNIKIRNNLALGGTQGAVVIGHDPITDKAFQPVLVTKNNFTTKETIKYVEKSDTDVHRLLGVEWMAYRPFKDDEKYADRVFGKLLDQSNTTAIVEMNVKSADFNESDQHTYSYRQPCQVVPAAEKIIFKMKNADGTTETKSIEKDEKYFDCATEPDDKTPLKLATSSIVRFISNTPTVSMMTDDVDLNQLGTPTVLITPGQVISGEGGGLTDAGGDSSSVAQTDFGSTSGGTHNDYGGSGGHDAKVPDMPLSVDDAQGEGGGGGSMIVGGSGFDAAPSASTGGISAGGCSMVPASGLMPTPLSLWWLVPTVTLLYTRKRHQ